MRLLHCDTDARLIYAPRDEDRYIRLPCAEGDSSSSLEIHVDRRLSQERRLLRKIEASLDDCFDGRKLKLYDELRSRHRAAMKRIIEDISLGISLAVGAS